MAREASEETSETERGKRRTPLSMIVPAALLVVAAVVITLLPHLGPGVQGAAIRFQDQAAYNRTVLSGSHIAHPVAISGPESTGITVADVVTGTARPLGGLVLAFSRSTGGGCPCSGGGSSRVPGWCSRSGGSRAA